MRRWLGAVLVGGLLLGLGSPAQALIIDDFSAGAFNLTDSGAGTTATQPCGSFCLGGTREVFLQGAVTGAPATAQLGLGEAQSVLPAGGTLSFTYTTALPVDLTVGGTATDIEVSFTVFEPGAELSVTLTDSSGVSETVTVSPSFPTPPTPSAPGMTSIPLSSFASADTSLIDVWVFDVGTDLTGGDYHVTLIQVPEPGPSTAAVLSLPGITVTSGPPYPSPGIPIGVAHPAPITPNVDGIVAGMHEGGQILADIVATIPPDDNRVVFLTTTLPGGPTSPTMQYRLDYLPPVGAVSADDQIPVLNWTPGNNWFEVKVDVEGEAGTETLTLFGEIGLGQPVNLSNVTAVKGTSTLVTVVVVGTVIGTQGIITMELTLEGSQIILVPVFAPHDLAPVLLAGLVIGGALILVTRVRRRGAAGDG